MDGNPRGDNRASRAEWARVLGHRRREGDEAFEAAVGRFEAAGLVPGAVAAHLADGGDQLYAAATANEPGWAERFGGDQAVALIAAEVGALMSHLVARAASVRGVCVEALLDNYSAVTVASALGVARQKVYGLAKPRVDPDYVFRTPWRQR